MNNNCVLSIIIPAYNVAPYIENCIRSVLEQTYYNLEIITVNDGSTDHTGKILDNLAAKDRRIQVIHQDNKGVTKARIAGIKAARGDWIGFVDGDDSVDQSMYEHLLRNAEKYNADISHCGYMMVFPSRVDYYYNTGKLIASDNYTGLKALLEGKIIEPSLGNKIFKKKLFKNIIDNDLMDYSIKYNEDLLMNFYLFREANLSVYEDICLYHYVLRKNSATSSQVNINKLLDPLRVLRMIRSGLKDDLPLQILVNAKIVNTLIGLSTIEIKDEKNDFRDIRRRARNELRRWRPELLRGNYSNRIKVLSTWVSLWPWSYYIVHLVYGRIRGTFNRYDIK